MIRQYCILTRTPDTQPAILEPGLHASLYNIPEIRSAIDYVKENEHVEMVGIRIATRIYTVAVVYDEKLKPSHFELKDA